MPAIASAISASASTSPLRAVARMPVPRGLVRSSRSPGRAPTGGQQPGRVDQAGYRQADLRLLVLDGVAADDHRPGFLHLLRAAAQDLHQDRAIEAGRKAYQGEGGQRRAAHGVDIREGVGGGDAAVARRIVDDRREEVDGLHQRPLFVEAVDPGIGEGDRGRQQIRVIEWR